MTQTLKTLIPLAIVFAVLVSTNFLYAAWSGPSATAPENNTDTPINVGVTPQAKGGLFGAIEITARDQVNSPKYCDGSGLNCFSAPPLCASLGWDGASWTCDSTATGTTATPTTSTGTSGCLPNVVYSQGPCVGTSEVQGR